MSDVDLLQNAEEEVAQMRQDEQQAAHQRQITDLAQQPLGETAERPRRQVTAPLSDVSVVQNMRASKNLDMPEVHELAVAIREVGLLNPPTVRATDDGGLELVAGHRRYAAMQLVEEAEGAPREWDWAVIDGMSKREALTVQFSENFHQAKPEPIEFARAVREIMKEDPKLTAASVSRMVGARPDWTRKSLALLKLPAIAGMVESGDLSFTAADMVRRAVDSGRVSEEQATDLAQQAVDGELSAAELKNGVGYVPPAPENYDETATQLDEARWNAARGAKNDNGLSVGTEDEDADWAASSMTEEPSFSTNQTVAASKKAAVFPQGEESQLIDLGDTEISGADLDSYLLMRLLRDVVSDEHLQQMGLQEHEVARHAFDLRPAEVTGALRNVALRMLHEDPQPPREMHHSMQD